MFLFFFVVFLLAAWFYQEADRKKNQQPGPTFDIAPPLSTRLVRLAKVSPVVALLAFAASYIAPTSSHDRATQHTESKTGSVDENTVWYSVEGQGTNLVMVTYTSPDGSGMSQQSVSPPYYSPTWTVKKGEFMIVSAQINDGFGTVDVMIHVNGKVFSKQSSTGSYVIASTNARCC